MTEDGRREMAMKAVMSEVPADILAWRKRTGADRWDEMWEGVLHMPPMPNREHQELEWAMETYLRLRWARPRKTKVYHNINVASPGGWPHDYRIPDLVLVSPERFGIDRNEYFEGAPDVVVEIRSPGDETYEKLEFYRHLGVPEVWVIDRDSEAPEIYALQAGRYEQRAADADGWVRSPLTRIELRTDKPGKLTVRLAGEEASREDLPED
jgi:Uma2 family endonuclease